MSIYEKFKSLLSEQEDEEVQSFVEDDSSSSALSNPLYWLLGVGGFFIAKSFFTKKPEDSKRFKVSGGMLLTNNFRIGEFLRSEAIPELKDYELNNAELSNLKRLAGILQSLRDDIGAPVIITSGGRPPTMTASEGKYKGMTFVEILRAKNHNPSELSQHMDFSAADITTQDKKWLPYIMKQMLGVYYGSALGNTITQVIIYIKDGVPDFIHFGVKSDIHDFKAITEGKRLLICEITSSIKDGKEHRKFQYHNFTVEKMNQLIAE